MANKKQTPDEKNVTRIKASDSSTPKTKKPQTEDKNVTKITATKAPAKEKAVAKAEATVAPSAKPAKKSRTFSVLKPFKATGSYFKGAWVELRQVRWPTRRATWGMTGAVLAYSAFFIVFVLLIDAGFKYIFELMIGK